MATGIALCALVSTLSADRVYTGPFATFNQMMEGQVIRVPPMNFSSDPEFRLIDDGKLGNISVGDIAVNGTRISDTEYEIALYIDKVDADLTALFEAKVGLLTQGWATMLLSDFTLNVTFGLTSPNKTVAPTAIHDRSCDLQKLGVEFHHCKGNPGHNALYWDTICVLGKDFAEVIIKGAIEPLACFVAKETIGLLLDGKLENISKALHNLDLLPYPVSPDPQFGEDDTEGLEDTADFNNSGLITGLEVFRNVFNVPGSGKYTYKEENVGFFGADLNKAVAQPLVINQLVDILLPKDKIYHPLNISLAPMTISKGLFEGVELGLTVAGLTLIGFDTITVFDVAEVLANHTLGLKVATGDTTIGVSLKLSIDIPDRLMIGGLRTVSDVDFSVTVDDFEFALNLVLGINGSTLLNADVGTLMNLSTLPACIGGTLKGINVTYLNIGLTKMTPNLEMRLVEPFAGNSGGFSELLNNVTISALDMYNGYIMEAFPAISDSVIKGLVNSVLQSIVSAPPKPCPPYVGTRSEATVDFYDSFLISAIDGGNNAIFNNFHSDMSINNFLFAYFNSSGEFNGTAFVLNKVIETSGKNIVQKGTPEDLKIGDIAVKISEITIAGINSFSDLELLVPNATDSTELANTIKFASFDDVNAYLRQGGNPQSLSISLRMHFQWDGLGSTIDNDVTMRLDLNEIDLELDIDATINKERLFETTLTDTLSQPTCLYSDMDAAMRVPVSSATIGKVGFSVHCHSCSGEALKAWAEKLDNNADAASERLTQDFNNGLAEFFAFPQSANATKQFDDIQKEAVCGEALPPYKKFNTTTLDSGETMRKILLVFTFTVIGLIFVFTAYRLRRALAEETHEFMHQEDGAEHACEIADDDCSTFGGETKWDTLRMGESIFAHPVVPAYIRYGVPLTLVVLMGLMVSADLYYNAVGIDYTLWMGGQTKLIVDYEYTTLKFMKDAWDANMFFLGAGIGFLSFSWAWIRIVTLLWLFFLPPTVIAHRKRTYMIGILDFLAKWSLLITYINLLLVPFVNVDVHPGNDSPVWYTNLLRLRVQIDHYYGYYCFAFVQWLGLLVGQVIMFSNRNVVASVKKEIREEASHAGGASASSDRSYATVMWFDEGAEDPTREAMRTHLHTKHTCFRWCVMEKKKSEKRAPIAWRARFLLIVSLLSCVGLLIAGAVTTSMGTENEGLINVFIEGSPDEVCFDCSFSGEVTRPS